MISVLTQARPVDRMTRIYTHLHAIRHEHDNIKAKELRILFNLKREDAEAMVKGWNEERDELAGVGGLASDPRKQD